MARTSGSTDAFLVGALLRARREHREGRHRGRAGPTRSTTPRRTSPAWSIRPDRPAFAAARRRGTRSPGSTRASLDANGEQPRRRATTTPTTTSSASRRADPAWATAPRAHSADRRAAAAPASATPGTTSSPTRAVATSRYREYFAAEDGGRPRDFTRTSEPVDVHVPASARPVAPRSATSCRPSAGSGSPPCNQVRSVRTGGGLRVYLDRPWYSSGGRRAARRHAEPQRRGPSRTVRTGSRTSRSGARTRSGRRPRCRTSRRSTTSRTRWRPSRVYRSTPARGRAPTWPRGGSTWPVTRCTSTTTASSTTATSPSTAKTATYAPFVRLALARYQPHALVSAKLSRVVLADFAQLTPERALTVTSDPYAPGVVRVAVSGPAPRGPVAHVEGAGGVGRRSADQDHGHRPGT